MCSKRILLSLVEHGPTLPEAATTAHALSRDLPSIGLASPPLTVEVGWETACSRVAAAEIICRRCVAVKSQSQP